MENWASKWLEMHSQRHRLKKIQGRSPRPHQMRGGTTNLPYPPHRDRFKHLAFSAPPPLRNNPFRSNSGAIAVTIVFPSVDWLVCHTLRLKYYS